MGRKAERDKKSLGSQANGSLSNQLPGFWNIPATDLLQQLQTTTQGLTSSEAQQRLTRYGSNLLKPKKKSNIINLLMGQFKSPLILILLGAATLAFFLHDPIDGLIILGIVIISGLLGFWQERGAVDAVEKLLALVEVKARVLRDGEAKEIPTEKVVPGDVVRLAAGDVVPGDSVILESKDLFIDEATLTGETFPAEKMPGKLPAETSLAQRTNTLFMGTHVVSGMAKAVVIQTGKETEFGKVSERLRLRPQETEFERGVRRFGYFLMEVTLVLVIAIFGINVFLSRPVLIIRTRQPFFQSKPGNYLLLVTLLIAGLTLLLPFTPLAKVFGFIPLPISFILFIGIIVGLFMVAAEVTKRIFRAGREKLDSGISDKAALN